MMMKNKLVYITYQTFPAFTANSIQTMTNIKFFCKLGIGVTLIFPLRNKESRSDINILQKFYEFSENFNSIGTIHPLPFKKITFFQRYMFLISHFLWSYFTVRKYAKNNNNETIYMTRSEWVFFFLSKLNKKVIYECHLLSSLKKKLIKKSIQKPNSKLILLTPQMNNDLKLENDNQFIILPNAYDEQVFGNNNLDKKNKRLVYAGTLFRFGETRGLELLTKESQNLKDLGVEIVIASSDSQVNRLKQDFIDIEGLNIEDHENLSRNEISRLYSSCEIGLLINNDSEHANKFTSPLKYFEYIASGLKVVAIDNPTHRNLPYQDKIEFFSSVSSSSFVEAIKQALKAEQPNYKNIDQYNMTNRCSRILNLFD